MAKVTGQFESVSYRIAGFAIEFTRTTFRWRHQEARARVPRGTPRDDREQETHTKVPKVLADEFDKLPMEGASA
jgi:hypothetical protein